MECKGAGEYLCNICLRKVPKAPEICPICIYYSHEGKTHVRCKKTLGLNGLIVGWRHQGVVRKAIHTLKYRFISDVSSELVEKYVLHFQKKLPKKALLVPIPLYKGRKKWRGFNQTEELGRRIARQMAWEYLPNALTKKKSDKPQSVLNRTERLRNIRGKYAVNQAQKKNIRGKQIVLFDDVWTTGATIKEACSVLKRNGAKKVWGMSITG